MDRPRWLLDGATPVVELYEDNDEPQCRCCPPLGVLVAFPNTTRREWVQRDRLVSYSDPSATPPWMQVTA